MKKSSHYKAQDLLFLQQIWMMVWAQMRKERTVPSVWMDSETRLWEPQKTATITSAWTASQSGRRLVTACKPLHWWERWSLMKSDNLLFCSCNMAGGVSFVCWFGLISYLNATWLVLDFFFFSNLHKMWGGHIWGESVYQPKCCKWWQFCIIMFRVCCLQYASSLFIGITIDKLVL